MADTLAADIGALNEKWKALTARRKRIADGKQKVEAEHAARKRNLRRLMDECQAAGHDPNNLKEDIARRLEVLQVKLTTLDSDLTAAEQILNPMLEEIGAG